MPFVGPKSPNEEKSLYVFRCNPVVISKYIYIYNDYMIIYIEIDRYIYKIYIEYHIYCMMYTLYIYIIIRTPSVHDLPLISRPFTLKQAKLQGLGLRRQCFISRCTVSCAQLGLESGRLVTLGCLGEMIPN